MTYTDVTEVNQNFSMMYCQGVFNPVKRHLSWMTDPEDRFQDAICMTWQDYVSATRKHKKLGPGAWVKQMQRRAGDLSRRFTGGQGRRRDAMGELAYLQDGIETLQLGSPHTQDDQSSEAWTYLEAVSLERSGRAEEHIISSLDLEAWIESLAADQKIIMRGKYAGLTDREIAAEVRCSREKVIYQTKRLGRELAERMGVEIKR